VLSFLPGLETSVFPYGVIVNGVDIRITWNCLGWQSFLLFFVSLLVGLKGPYTKISKLEAVIVGLLGTFLMNIVGGGACLWSCFIIIFRRFWLLFGCFSFGGLVMLIF